MSGTKDELIKGRFTKYVETAIKRARRDYIKELEKQNRLEELTEPDRLMPERVNDGSEMEVCITELTERIPWEPEAIRLFLKMQTDAGMEDVLSRLTDREIVIVFAKVFREMTFMEIGNIMGLEGKSVASVYSYARKKMKKGWEENGI